MRIARHAVDVEYQQSFFNQEFQSMLEYLETARRSSRSLSSLVMASRFVYRSGSTFAPDSSKVAQAICLSAQANAAMLVFARVSVRVRYCRLGNGPPVTYDQPVDESYIHPVRWVEAFYQATVSRQPDLLALLRKIPTDLLRQSSTRGEEGAYQWVDMHRAILEEEHFTSHPAFVAVQADCLSELEHGVLGKDVQLLTVPLFPVLQQLERGHVTGFNEALTEALLLHKKYWGATEKRRKNSEGFVSLQLTALAALAWDRGMRFDVESDYIPTPWVRGDLFRQG